MALTITLQDAKDHLNIEDDSEDTELTFFVEAANSWIATQVSDTTPAPVQLATRELVRHWWQVSQLGPVDLTEPDDDVGLAGLRIPPFVHEMLGPYLFGANGTGSASPVGSFPAAPCWPDSAAGW